MPDGANGFVPGGAWFSGAKVASVIGAVTALVFGVWGYILVSGHCGVVRFYEYIFGGLLIGGWLAGTALGLTIASIARRKRAKAFVVIGCAVAMLANIGLVIVSAKVAYDFLRRI